MTKDSPYVSLVNYCYQLRHENEELLEAMNLKSGLVEACEKEISLLKERLRELETKQTTESEQALADRMEISSDRYVMMDRNMRLESQVREQEVRINSLETQLEISKEQIATLHSLTNMQPPPSGEQLPVAGRLEEENERLRKQLETASYIMSAKRKKLSTESVPPSAQTSPAKEPSILQVSSDDSLLRLYERLAGYSIVRSDKTVTMVSNLDENTVVRFRVDNDDISVLASEGIEEQALAVLKTFDSVPGLLAKLTLSCLSKSLFSSNQS